MNHYIGDLHFNDTANMVLDKRPWSSIEEMNDALIENWNRKVSANDDTYIVGDFYDFDKCSVNKPYDFISKLKGRKHLILGNHDSYILDDKDALNCLTSVHYSLIVFDVYKGRKVSIDVRHHPTPVWNAQHKGSWHIYAHVHNSEIDVQKYMASRGNAYNCGCMINNFVPATLEELVENNKKFLSEH